MNTQATPDIQVPDTIGAPFEGGFYGGEIRIGEAICAVVWAPKAEGEITGKWMNTCTPVQGATNYYDSMANTMAMADAGSPIAKQAIAATIGGFTDWCVPARDVLEMGYRYLKPTTEENDVYRYGDNPSSIPAGYPYTEASPAQTTVEAFQEGGTEAFETTWYVASTQYSEGYAWVQSFGYGTQGRSRKSSERRCRFVRLILLTA